MADCGATGTAIDRAVASLTNTSQSSVSKQAAAALWMGGQASTTTRPLAAPTQVPLRGPPSLAAPPPQSAMAQQSISQQQQVLAQQQQQQPHHFGATTAPAAMQQPLIMHPSMHAPPPMAMAHPFQQQQQQMLMMMQVQQQQIVMQQQQQARQAAKSVAKGDVTTDWHQGLERDVATALEEHVEEVAGHEGLTKDVGIEELAAAWASAQDDYDNHFASYDNPDMEEPGNLWSGYDQEEQNETYTFTHTDRPVEAVDPSQQQQLPPHDWMQEGLDHFRQGQLQEAIRSFELELQFHDNDNALAWRMLGRCHAENDMDREAILCLQQSVDRDPYSPEALLALGVSFVNELNHEQALASLKAWITHNPKYAGLDLTSVEDDLYGSSSSASATAGGSTETPFEEAQRLLIRALEFDLSDSADVLEALGVVYNVSRDYEAAVASFRKALEVRPNDYQLWNKLGATLANAGQSEKALPAYQRALAIKPRYARAWLNMAISHSNLQNYDESARCYLQTISLNPAALHCWSYLRIALSCSERWDLIPFAASQDLQAFHEHFDFVTS